MTPFAKLRESPAFAALLDVSQRLGRNPLQVQGPGGNTSVKADGAMWVKASGTWLAEAREREIMVPVDAAAMAEALRTGDSAAEDGKAFAVAAENPTGLRPSIETSVHAILDWPVVLHTHCVATIATAVRRDAEAVTRDRLGDLGTVFIPYTKPGADLARAILDRVQPESRVLILGNHGLVVGGDTPAEAEALLQEVSSRLEPAMPVGGAAPEFAGPLAGTGWQAAPPGLVHGVARDPERLAIADGASLYPDHLIFLGPGIAVAQEGEAPGAAAERVAAGGAPRKLVLVPGAGAVVPSDASPSVLALAVALGDVVMRIDPAAPISRLSDSDEYALLNWDAEKHGQALEAARTADP